MLKNFHLTSISVTATPETAIKKLKKSEIGVYNCKKEGARFIFSVKDKDLKKVFAIFGKPCYNVITYGESGKKRLLSRAIVRAGLIAGAALFIAGAVLSQSLVLKIEVTGSGSYLSPEIKSIIYESGAKEWRTLSSFDAPVATGKILALPRVTFCRIQKRGSVLCVDVHTDAENTQSVTRTPLIADISGTLKNLVAICGTPCAEIGAQVSAGDILIDATVLSGEEYIASIAVGYAEIEWSGESVYFAPSESEQNLKNAYASLGLEGEITSRSHTVEEVEGGVNYVLKFTCLHRVSINL